MVKKMSLMKSKIVGNPHVHVFIDIYILFIWGLSPHSFVYILFFPKKYDCLCLYILFITHVRYYGTLSAHLIIIFSNKVSPNIFYNHNFLICSHMI